MVDTFFSGALADVYLVFLLRQQLGQIAEDGIRLHTVFFSVDPGSHWKAASARKAVHFSGRTRRPPYMAFTAQVM